MDRLGVRRGELPAFAIHDTERKGGRLFREAAWEWASGNGEWPCMPTYDRGTISHRTQCLSQPASRIVAPALPAEVYVKPEARESELAEWIFEFKQGALTPHLKAEPAAAASSAPGRGGEQPAGSEGGAAASHTEF